MPVGHHHCADCGKESPETELSYSLLSLSGWRELRLSDGAGGSGTKSEWRCPSCWAMYKRRTRAQTQTNLPKLDDLRGRGRKD